MAQECKEGTELAGIEDIITYNPCGSQRGVVRGRIESRNRGITKPSDSQILELVDIRPADGSPAVTAYIKR